MSIQKQNLLIAEKFRLLGDISQLDSVWAARAYYKAADVIGNLDVPIDSVSDYESLPGVGKSIAKKIQEIIDTGTCKKLESLKDENPGIVDALSMTTVSGIGVKKALAYYKDGIQNFDQLVEAVKEGRITTASIVQGVKLAQKSAGRIPINDVLPVVTPILDSLRALPEVERAEFAGSVRRGRETVRDVDIIVASKRIDRETISSHFLSLGEELVSGDKKARIFVPVSRNVSVQVDLLFTARESWGAAIAYFTGSKEHNIAIRTLANRKGYTLNENGMSKLGTIVGIRQQRDGYDIAVHEEEDIYRILGIPFCPPELREGYELFERSVPKIVEREDINTDWHMHTTWSRDAKASFEAMAIAAKERGLKRIGVTDHTEIQYGWDPERIDERRAEAEAAAETVGIEIAAACETGVNKDGSLDWPDKYLTKMDYVIASIHRSHSTDPVKRLIAAAKHPMVKMIGHPTGRMLGRRDIPDDDWTELFKVCYNEGVLLEINGARMDLPVDLVCQARDEGCKFVLTSDAHNTWQLQWQDYAIMLARRAGLTNGDLAIPF